MEVIAESEFSDFNFNDPPTNTAQPRDDLAMLSRESIAFDMPTLDDDGAAQLAREAIFEPIQSGLQSQDFMMDAQVRSNDQAFLDDVSGAIRHEPRLTSDTLSESHELSYNAGGTAAETLDFGDNSDVFDIYFNDTMNDPSLVQPESTNLDAEPQRIAGAQPQYADNNVNNTQRATLLFLLEQLEDLTRPPDSEAGHATTLAQRIASVNALSPREFRAFSDSMFEKLHTMALSQQNDPAIDTSQLGRETTAPLADATTHDNTTLDFLSQPQNSPLPDEHLSDPFAPIQWDDLEIWNSSLLSPDPTRRTFFPELDLAISS